MAIKDLMNQAKDHPVMVSIALFACIVVGGFGAPLYIKVSEQRTGLLGDRITQLELNDMHQKRVNQIILGQIQALRSGYENLPVSLKNVKTEFEYVCSLRVLAEPKRKDIISVIEALGNDIRQVELALEKSEAILNTFDRFLNTSAVELNGLDDFKANLLIEDVVPISVIEKINEISKSLTPEQVKKAEELMKQYEQIEAELPSPSIQPKPKRSAAE